MTDEHEAFLHKMIDMGGAVMALRIGDSIAVCPLPPQFTKAVRDYKVAGKTLEPLFLQVCEALIKQIEPDN